MPLIIGIDAIVVGVIVLIALTKGVERALPFCAFVLVLAPLDSKIVVAEFCDLTTQRVATITLAAVYLAFGAGKADERDKERTPLMYLILLNLGWSLISTTNSIVFMTSLKATLSAVLDIYLLYYIFVKSVSTTESVHRILRAFVAALVICCVFGWIEAYYDWRVMNLFPTIVHRFTPGQGGLMLDEGRVKSTFPHAILFGNALALGIPIAFYLLTVAKSAGQRIWLWTCVLLMFWNMYKTSSRGPWLALVLSAILLLLFSQGNVRKYLVVVTLLTVSVLVIRPGVWDTLKNTYLETMDPDDPRGQSYQYRYDLMHVASERLARDGKRAIWGFGPESFYYAGFEGVDSETGHTYKFESCDSAFVETMVDTGYIGLLLLIALLLKPMLVSLRGFSGLPRPPNLLCLVLLVNQVAFAFMMMSVGNWGWGQQTFMIWIIFALAMTYPRLVRSEASISHVGQPERIALCEPMTALASL